VRAVLTVFAKEFRENLRERRTLFSALILGPLLGPLLFAGMLSLRIERGADEGERPLELAVAHAERAPNLIDFLRQYDVHVTPVDYDDAAARAAVLNARHQQVLIVGAEFAARLAAGMPAPLMLYADTSDVSAAGERARARALISQYASLLARLRVAVRGIDPLTVSPIALQDVDVSTPATRSVLLLGTLTVSAFAVVLHFTGLERFGMSVNFGPSVAARVILFCLPLVPLGAALMTIVAAYTRTYREAQTWLALVLLVPTLPLVFAGVLDLRAQLPLMAVPSLSQHFLITSLLRDEPLPWTYLATSTAATLALAALLIVAAGRLYRREALLG